MDHAIPHPSGLFSGRMAARLAPEAWAEVVRAPRPAATPRLLAGALIAAQIAVLGLTAWSVRQSATALPTRALAATALPEPWHPEPLPSSAPAAEAPAPPPSRPLPPEGLAPMAPQPPSALRLSTTAAVVSAASAPAEPDEDVVLVRVMTTGYCPCARCCAGSDDGVTAINRDVDEHPRGIAADPRLVPYRTWLEVPGYGRAMVDDTGGAMRQSGADGIVHLDLRFRTHREAQRWGVQWHEIAVPRSAPAASLAASAVSGR